MPWNNNCADSVNQKPHCQQENFPGKYEDNKEIPPFRAPATPTPPVGTNRHQGKSFFLVFARRAHFLRCNKRSPSPFPSLAGVVSPKTNDFLRNV
ncbi:hypothetical protein AVEN_143235-1 [Araneus ventricosus]|uniref:Uncharacterized protein n=1 Tax=Araneus ventricosus TaxID=182803 RepID=A0A4Y2ADX0_ARAVE|nr:hypothetical protein AVEN_143235-1 [Araneus ventricosus]